MKLSFAVTRQIEILIVGIHPIDVYAILTADLELISTAYSGATFRGRVTLIYIMQTLTVRTTKDCGYEIYQVLCTGFVLISGSPLKMIIALVVGQNGDGHGFVYVIKR